MSDESRPIIKKKNLYSILNSWTSSVHQFRVIAPRPRTYARDGYRYVRAFVHRSRVRAYVCTRVCVRTPGLDNAPAVTRRLRR